MEHLIGRNLRQIGSTDLFLPTLGVGCSPLGEVWEKVPVVDAISTLYAAADLYNGCYFDTAPWYGNGCSEARVGIAINSLMSEKSVRVKVSTKVGKFLDPSPKENNVGPWVGGYDLMVRPDYSYRGIMQQFRESCLRLGTHSVDAIVIHDLDTWHLGKQTQWHLEQLNDLSDGGLKALLDLKKAGKIKAIGIGCNAFQHNTSEICRQVSDAAREMEKLQNDSKIKALDYILCAGAYNLITQEAADELIPLCKLHGMSLVIGAPYGGNGAILAQGVKKNASKREDMTFMYFTAPSEIIDKVLNIEEVCEKHKVSLGAAALQFPLLNPAVACVLAGVKSREEVQLAAKYMDKKIPEAFWKELRGLKLIR